MTKTSSDVAAAGPAPYVAIRDLIKRFGDFTALTSIDLDIHEGEFVCFLGPSGCGKTTLLRAIAGLDIQTSGTVVQAGRDVSALPPSARDFGIVFQSYALFPNLTIAQNIAYGLHGRKMNKRAIAARVDELLSLVSLSDQKTKYPAQLSGGQQQRVALARALAPNPGLLLLDEPLSALDAKVRGHLRHEIKELQRTIGVTTIMVTHDQEEALTMADRIVVMNHGAIEQVGTPEDIYRAPASEFVADFIGTTNLIRGQVGDGAHVVIGETPLNVGASPLARGAAALVSVRPEDVRIGMQRRFDDNALQATVMKMEFMGAFCRATLRCAALDAKDLRVDVSFDACEEHGLAVGEELWVALPPDRVRVFAAGAS